MFTMQEISLYKLLAFYAKNWLLILCLTLTGLLIGVLYNNYVQVPMYKSNATLLYINPNARTTQDVTLLNNYVQLFTSRRVIDPVLQDLNIDKSYDEFAGAVTASNEKGTEVLKLSVATDDPDLSREFLSEAMISFQEQAENLYESDNLTVVDNASMATPPYNVNHAQQLIIASLIGFATSLIALFFVYDIKGDLPKNKSKKSKKKSKSIGLLAGINFLKPKVQPLDVQDVTKSTPAKTAQKPGTTKKVTSKKSTATRKATSKKTATSKKQSARSATAKTASKPVTAKKTPAKKSTKKSDAL